MRERMEPEPEPMQILAALEGGKLAFVRLDFLGNRVHIVERRARKLELRTRLQRDRRAGAQQCDRRYSLYSRVLRAEIK